MPAYTKEMGGAAIISKLRANLAEHKTTVATVTGGDQYPAEYRRKVRVDSLREVSIALLDARTAILAWSSEQIAAAQKRYAAAGDSLGTEAAETRRLANETRITRLVETARLTDQRNGPKILGAGASPVDNETAYEYADRATDLYMAGRYDEAQVYATASTALGGPVKAQKAYKAAQDQLDLDNPERAAALKDIAEAQHVASEFVKAERAAQVDTLSAAIVASRAIGDDPRPYMERASALSMEGKLAAMHEAAASGTAYAEPTGTLASSPTGAPNARGIPDGFGPTPAPVTEPYEAGHVTRVGS